MSKLSGRIVDLSNVMSDVITEYRWERVVAQDNRKAIDTQCYFSN